MTRNGLTALGIGLWIGMSGAVALAAETTNPAPTPQDWAALSKLPDWSGVWLPDTRQSNHPFAGKSEPPWTPEAARHIAAQRARDKAGNPDNFYAECLPEGVPSVVIMTLNTAEFLFTPGRVTYLNEFDGNRLRRIYTDGRGHPEDPDLTFSVNEFDGNRLRRIYTDGRGHPEDPDLTFSGHSIGHWEGDTLVVDTVAIRPESYLPLGQSVGFPNNGDLHVVERIHLVGPDRLVDELDIDAPHALTDHWKIDKYFVRSRKRSDDIVEASCRQGDFVARRDEDGNHIFVPAEQQDGGVRLHPAGR